LVDNDGTLNWFCMPNFDSTSLFGHCSTQIHGRFRFLGPAEPASDDNIICPKLRAGDE
jgi:hypothetical protein